MWRCEKCFSSWKSGSLNEDHRSSCLQGLITLIRTHLQPIKVPDPFINHFFNSRYGLLTPSQEGKRGKDQVEPHTVIIPMTVKILVKVWKYYRPREDRLSMPWQIMQSCLRICVNYVYFSLCGLDHRDRQIKLHTGVNRIVRTSNFFFSSCSSEWVYLCFRWWLIIILVCVDYTNGIR